MYFPAQTCAAIGFFYPGCSSSVPLNAPDYHYYALTALSPYHNQASDGTDLGAIISVIDAMQTVNLSTVPPCIRGDHRDHFRIPIMCNRQLRLRVLSLQAKVR